ncbi:Spo11/DNA topoisomerase VI subunit A [Aspergillus ambiguus]|uniref:putative meiosis-specific topoisomerase Spo11 n=1 Tax=Aspergillus ambiguus TaxID=176160 RepID=UPI003CCE22B0
MGVDRAALNVEVLIPRTQDIVEVDIANAEWILIIEKEAVFRRLTASNFHLNSAAGKGILITGKGYPDLNTRAFVRALSDGCARLDKPPQFYVLVDSDPDGMAIMSTYKYGTMAHASDNARLNVPCIRWLGLRTSDVAADTDPLGDNSLIKLTTRDRKKAVSMLSNSPVWADSGPELEWRAELQQMLMLNLKAEIETLYNREGGIERWISQKMTVR